MQMGLFEKEAPPVSTSRPASIDKAIEIIESLSTLAVDDRIVAVNELRRAIHGISPMRHEPVDCVLWVKNDTVKANDYNPNSVAPPEMELLKISIGEDGYTQPIVTFKNEDMLEVVDGFHRHRVGKEDATIQARVHGYLPVVVINEDRQDKADRIASTIRHNRARGKHKVEAMSDIVLDLRKRNWNDEKVA